MTDLNDQFLQKSDCDRCSKKLYPSRIMSWFTEETICMACSTKENEVKTKLRFLGIENAMEGCGFVPQIQECDQCNGYGSSLKEEADKCTKCKGTGLIVKATL
jgi:DnaJ-class molecular chaperone